MDHSKLRGVVAIENGVWFSPFGHEIPAAENLEFVTFGFHHELVSSQNAEIERLRALVDQQQGVIRVLGMACDKGHNDAIEAAAQEIDCGGQCGACGSHGHCYSEMAATIYALKK